MSIKSYHEPKRLPKYGSISQILDNIEPNKVVLDVGCSKGYLAKYLINNIVYGINYNEQDLQEAKKYCKGVLLINLNEMGRLKEEGFMKLQFDYIVFSDVLEHVLSPDEVLNFFKNKLSNEGKIITSLPNVALWRVRVLLLFGKFDYTDYGVLDSTHLHLYTFKTAKELLEKCGLKVIKTSGAANLLGVIVRIAPFLRKLLSIHIINVSENR